MSFVAGAGIVNVDLIYSGLAALPKEGREVFATEFDIQLGGGVAATLAQVGHLGVPAKVGTYLGEDLFSRYAAEELAKHPLALTNLYRQTGGIPLSVTSVALTPKDRTFLSYADTPVITDRDLERVYALCKGARIVEMQPGYLEVYRRLHKDGCLLVLDLSWDEDMGTGKYDEYLTLADYFTPNRGEAMQITGTGTPQAAAQKLSEYFDKVIVKLDSEGCLVLENGKQSIVKNIPCTQAVDATGAGDAFLAGLLYGIFHRKSFLESVLYGNITGANCVLHKGCMASPLGEQELLNKAEEYRYLID